MKSLNIMLLVLSLMIAGVCIAAEPLSPASNEYMQSMDSMHKDMMEGVMDADPDVAFVQGMIAHHKGAVQMAKTELKYGKDPNLKQLSKDIISIQEKEIEYMQNWLNEHKAAATTASK